MNILCIGHAAYDITIPIEKFIVENTKNRITNRIECGGGPASTAAYLLGKWHANVSFAGVVGLDEYGKYIKKELESVNVNTKYLEMNENYTTTSSIVVANTSNGSRTILTYRPNEMKMQDINLDFNPGIILIDGQEYEVSKKILSNYKSSISIMDAGRINDEIIELSKMVNYLICSKNFAEQVTNIKIDYNDMNTLKQLFLNLKNIFKNNIIVTLESHGCLYEYNNEIKIMPSIKVKPIDSTGAGDIFHGAFTYFLSKNYEYEQILKLSNITAALSTTKLGGRNSVFELNEVMEKYNEVK